MKRKMRMSATTCGRRSLRSDLRCSNVWHVTPHIACTKPTPSCDSATGKSRRKLRRPRSSLTRLEPRMHPYPHVYTAAASGRPEGTVAVTSTRLPEIASAPPPEFDGPGDVWSPETLLCASVADCFVLSFRAIARASKLEWSELACQVEGVLERVDGVTQFTRYTTFASLKVSSESDA